MSQYSEINRCGEKLNHLKNKLDKN